MNRRPRKYYKDIKLSDLFDGNAISVLIVLSLIGILVYFLVLTCISADYDSIIAHNETAQSFNALTLQERQTIAEWDKSLESLDDEALLIAMKPEPKPKKAGYLRAFLIMLAIYVVIVSFVVFGRYCSEQYSEYFIADLPFDTIYGWVLFMMMFAGWPFLMVSAIRMWLYFRPKHQAEKEAVENQARIELSEEQAYTLTQSPEIRFPKKARKAYIQYRVKGSKQAQQKLIEAAEDKVARTKRSISECGEKIQRLQREYGEAKAELNRLTSIDDYTNATRVQAKAEWEALAEMRGVAKITAKEKRGDRPDRIFILVKVRVPYRGDVYDFGDYQITLRGSEFKCVRLRSGVKIDHTSTSPDYYESSGFCFGSRKSTIKEYLGQGKTIEAVTLMIDCLHSVNDGYEDDIPRCFRKVETVERAKRRLQRQAKNKGGVKNG